MYGAGNFGVPRSRFAASARYTLSLSPLDSNSILRTAATKIDNSYRSSRERSSSSTDTFLRARGTATGNGGLGIRSVPVRRDAVRRGFYIAEADIMVHMWVNTVTGCGLPREEINGLRFGPPVDRAMPLV